MALTASSMRYLLAIYQLSDGGAAVRSVDIANTLHVTRASVVKSLKTLVEEGYILKEYYGNIQLTPFGVRESNQLYTEYTLLHFYFLEILHVSEESADQDALAALCSISKESRTHWVQLALENQPRIHI